MARVTVEDCVEKVSNRFELVMLSAQRAREIGAGASLLVERDNDKNSVVALRELADDKIHADELQEDLIRSHQRIIAMDDDEDIIDLMDGEDGFDAIAAARNEEEMGDEFDGGDDSGEPSLEDLAGLPAAD